MTSSGRSCRLRAAAAVFAGLFVVAAPAAAGDYELVWSDEFDGTEVDLSKWEFQIGTGCPDLCGWGNNELQYYRAENTSVSGGFLTITAKEESFGGRQYTSSRLRTQYLGDWTNGRFEIRAKMPIGQGIWPAFWMLPTDSPYGGWPTSGEIDILEYLGQEPARVFGTLHYGGPDQFFESTSYTLPSGTFHDDFHEFALEWDRNQIRWYVDGLQYACNSHWWSSAADYPAPFDQPFHLLMNMAVGGNLPGSPDETTEFPQEYVVDYVRVYQRTVEPPRVVLFDGMDHANPLANNWFSGNGSGGGGIQGNTSDLPPDDGCRASLAAGWGGPAGFIGYFGRRNPVNLRDMSQFTFWINPDADQTYSLEINLQDDDNGDDNIPPTNDGQDDEFQYRFEVSPTGPDAIAGGGWQKITIPFSEFEDDNSYHTGGNGIFDPIPTSDGGNGQLVNVVIVILAPTGGGEQTFRTDYWGFEGDDIVSTDGPIAISRPTLLGPAVPNPFHPSTELRFTLVESERVALHVYDTGGRLIRVLADGERGPGDHAATWDGRDGRGRPAAPGVYFVRLTAGAQTDGRRIVLRR